MVHKSRSNTAAIVQSHDVLGGKACVLRTRASGDVWQFRMWVAEEKKYVRQTLKTRDLPTAIKRAEAKYIELYANVQAGKKLFGITLAELVSLYLAWRQADVEGGGITAGRLSTIRTQLKHFTAYKGEKTRLSELGRSALYDYAQWRRKTKLGVQDVTIKNEQVTFNHMMRFAYRNGYAHFDGFEFANLKIKEVSRRSTFNLDEYDALVRCLRGWTSKRLAPDPEQRLERQMIRDCIYVASNTMLRVGELWQLRWGDIVGYKDLLDELGKPTTLVTLNVRKETAKNRKSRTVITRGGQYLRRLYERAKWKGKDDLIFCGEAGDERYSKRKFYAAWAELMKEIGVDYKQRNLTWYSLRHFGVTCRLRAGASIFDVAKIVGTSAVFIDQHYGHFDQSMSEAVARKNFVVTKDGFRFFGDS